MENEGFPFHEVSESDYEGHEERDRIKDIRDVYGQDNDEFHNNKGKPKKQPSSEGRPVLYL